LNVEGRRQFAEGELALIKVFYRDTGRSSAYCWSIMAAIGFPHRVLCSYRVLRSNTFNFAFRHQVKEHINEHAKKTREERRSEILGQ